MPKPIEILGVKVDPLTWAEVNSKLEELLDRKSKSQIVTINAEFLRLAEQNIEFKECLNMANLRVSDGVGVMISASLLNSRLVSAPVFRQLQAYFKLLGYFLAPVFYPKVIKNPIPERIAGVDLATKLIELAAKKNLRVFLLGARVGVAEKAALKLQTDYYGLRIAGTYSGTPSVDKEEKIIELINKHKADILLVAYGAPKQDLWIKKNLSKLSIKIAVGVGGTFDFFADETKRAPLWMQKRGLEWLHRLYLHPLKRFTRTLALTGLFLRVVRARLSQK